MLDQDIITNKRRGKMCSWKPNKEWPLQCIDSNNVTCLDTDILLHCTTCTNVKTSFLCFVFTFLFLSNFFRKTKTKFYKIDCFSYSKQESSLESKQWVFIWLLYLPNVSIIQTKHSFKVSKNKNSPR